MAIVDKDIIDFMLHIIQLTGEYIEQEERNETEIDLDTEKKYRRLVIKGEMYAEELKGLLKKGDASI
jgi:hypothetical protein